MDGSLLDAKYMNLRHSEALKYIKTLVNRIKMFDGDFVLLWHNTMLTTRELKSFYEMVVKTALLDDSCEEGNYGGDR